MYPYKRIKKDRKDEHRVLWEKAYGKIPKGYVVHHINENKKDNVLSNLELKTRAEHTKDHFKGVSVKSRISKDAFDKMLMAIRESNKRLRKVIDDSTAWCAKCKTFLPVSYFSKNASRFNGLQNQCKECRRLRNKKKGNC